MLSDKTLEMYRRMTPGERLRLTLELMRESERYLLVGTPEQIDRKFELLERENDARNRAMLTAIAASERRLAELRAAREEE
jgi:hypothetical protein